MTKRINIEALKQYLLTTGIMLPLMVEIGGLEDGDESQGRPCPFCGGDDRCWYSVELGKLYCRKCMPDDRGYSIFDLVMHRHKVEFREALEMVATRSGFVDNTARVPTKTKASQRTGGKSKRFRPGTFNKTEYIYTDESGNLRHKVIRFNGIEESTGKPAKTFSQWKIRDGEWTRGAPDTTFPYHLPDVLQADTIIIVEGEKTADCLNRALQAAGNTAIATTSPMGAPSGKQWEKYVQRYPGMAGKSIRILPDRDEPGMKYARTVAAAFVKANPSADVKIVELSDRPLPEGGDFVDWCTGLVADGKDETAAIETLFELCKRAEPVTPDAVATWNTESAKNKSTPSNRDKTDKYSENGVRPILVRVSEVEEKEIQWLWHNKIPLGMLSLITGLSGIGKSFLTVYMAAVITNGWKWADGSVSTQGSVLFFYGEESIADTYKKRFRANEADQTKIVFLNGVEMTDEEGERSEEDVTLEMVEVIETAIRETEETTGSPVRMVIIDPVSNYWGDIKENSNADVRSVFKPLQHLAEKTGVAFVLIQHTGKGEKEHAQQQVLGSTGIVAACRSVWGVFVDPADKGKLIFAPVKINCGYNHTAVSYRIAPPDGTVEIVEASIENLTGDDIVIAQRQKSTKAGRPATERNACVALLANNLKDGRKPASEMKKILSAEGFSKDTIKAAKESLGVVAFRDSDAKDWFWHIPPDSDVEDSD